ncbi:hypothetical protein C5167_012290 [Papaver somniferum]|uniref:Uncharacterized protein n=1 Tax=Papaver somniferum TaxID=3469 RepID=A0A4Y7J0Z4_PAPSO|nr:hypothetical protein C5167_012290 [Papaver somniferum]
MEAEDYSLKREKEKILPCCSENLLHSYNLFKFLVWSRCVLGSPELLARESRRPEEVEEETRELATMSAPLRRLGISVRNFSSKVEGGS